MASFLLSSNHETFVKKIAGFFFFGGGGIEEAVYCVTRAGGEKLVAKKGVPPLPERWP